MAQRIGLGSVEASGGTDGLHARSFVLSLSSRGAAFTLQSLAAFGETEEHQAIPPRPGDRAGGGAERTVKPAFALNAVGHDLRHDSTVLIHPGKFRPRRRHPFVGLFASFLAGMVF